MIAKPNFYSYSVFAENDRRWNAQTRDKIRQADLRGYVHNRHIESLLVRISPRVHITDISRQMQDHVHWHGQSHLECDDVYKNMKSDIAKFDTSDYPADNVYGMPLANKKVPDEGRK